MRDFSEALEQAFPVPAHIAACASAIRYDLYHGPCFSCVPAEGIEAFTIDHYASDASDLADIDGTISETYVGPVADALRSFIDDLPSEVWVDVQCDCVCTSEPEAFEEDGEWYEPCWDDYYHLDRSDIVAGLFGKTIAREFN